MATPKKSRKSTPQRTVSSRKLQRASRGKVTRAQFALPTLPKIRRMYVWVGLAVVVLAALLYFSRSLILAATVNGQPIMRFQVVRELEKKQGKAMLTTIITKYLVFQEAKRLGISVSDAELSDEVKKIEQSVSKQGQKLDDVLAQQGLSRDDLGDRVKIQKIAERVFAKDIAASDKEIDDYIEKNKDSFPADEKSEDVRATVARQLRQQKLETKFQSWLQGLRAKAKITYYVSY